MNIEMLRFFCVIFYIIFHLNSIDGFVYGAIACERNTTGKFMSMDLTNCKAIACLVISGGRSYEIGITFESENDNSHVISTLNFIPEEGNTKYLIVEKDYEIHSQGGVTIRAFQSFIAPKRAKSVLGILEIIIVTAENPRNIIICGQIEVIIDTE